MVQFNLLPDVKLQYIKANRTKHMMEVVSSIVTIVSIVVFVFMMVTVNVVQKKSLSDLNSDIKKYSTQLKSVPNLNDILTVQNQLNTLSALHDKKVVASRLFDYLSQVTPATASLSKVSVDFTQNTIILSGSAPSLDIVNTYTDTLKTTKYTTATNTTGKTPAFSKVVLTAFGRGTKGATFTISASFDPAIFNSASDVKLVVPAEATVDPAALFESQAGN